MEKSFVRGKWQVKRTYSPAVITQGATKTIWVAGHTGAVDDAGKSLAGDFDAQCRQTFRNIEKTLAEAGAKLSDIAPVKARPERVIEPSASPAGPPPEPPKPETPQTDIAETAPAGPAAGNGRPRAKERAEAFVREQLANGPRYGELVKRDAAEYAKISERTLIAPAERGRAFMKTRHHLSVYRH